MSVRFMMLMSVLFLVSQVDGWAQVSVGLHVGATRSTLSSNRADVAFKGVTFSHVGAKVKYKFDSDLYVLGSYQYGSLGAKLEREWSFQSEKYRLNYATIIHAIGYQKNRFGLHAGLYLGALAVDHIKRGNADWVRNSANDFEDVDAGLYFGTIYSFGRIYVNAAYQLGVTFAYDQVITDDVGSLVGTSNGENRALHLAIGYYIVGKNN